MGRRVLYLDGFGDERGLSLGDWDRSWDGSWWFLGVQEVSDA